MVVKDDKRKIYPLTDMLMPINNNISDKEYK